MFDRYRAARDEPKELDLVPIMNLMVTLIPFLMLGAAFYQIGVIPTSLPTEVEAVDQPPPSEVVVTMNLLVAADRLELSGSGAGLAGEAREGLRAVLPRAAQGYDLPGLTAKLDAIKRQYPKSDTLVVFPEDRIDWQTLVDVLDATRDKPVEGAPEDTRAPLFPVTVFSKPPVPDPLAEEGAEGEGAGSEGAAGEGGR